MEGCDGELDGAPGELTFRRYVRFGAGGAKLLWGEACAVNMHARANPRQIVLNESTKSAFARIVEECREAVVWLFREGPRHGLPVRPLVVSGHSAGGHLAAMLVATDWRARGLPADTIAGAVALSGVFDLEPLVQVSFNVDLKLDAGHAYLVSPIHLQPRVPVPMLVAAGEDETDEFIRQSWLLWERWPECHPSGQHGPLFIPGCHHFSVPCELANPASELVRQTLALF